MIEGKKIHCLIEKKEEQRDEIEEELNGSKKLFIDLSLLPINLLSLLKSQNIKNLHIAIKILEASSLNLMRNFSEINITTIIIHVHDQHTDNVHKVT